MKGNAEWDKNPTDGFEISIEKACFENSLENHCNSPVKKEVDTLHKELMKKLSFKNTRL